MLGRITRGNWLCTRARLDQTSSSSNAFTFTMLPSQTAHLNPMWEVELSGILEFEHSVSIAIGFVDKAKKGAALHYPCLALARAQRIDSRPGQMKMGLSGTSICESVGRTESSLFATIQFAVRLYLIPCWFG